MPNKKEDSPFFFEADVDTKNLRQSLSKAEKMYLSMSKQSAGMVQGLEDQSDALKKWGEQSKKQAEKDESRRESLFGKFKHTLFQRRKEQDNQDKKRNKGAKDNAKKREGIFKRMFKKEKESIKDSGVSWKGLAGIIGGGALVGAIVSATKAYFEFNRQQRELNATLGDQTKVYAAASSMAIKYRGYLNLAREEIIQITKQIGEMNMVTGNTAKSAAKMRFLTMETIHLSKAMDVASGSVVDTFDVFTRIYKLPHHQLRGISASMKFIQESTAISGEELLSFAKGLDDVLSRMTKVSGKGKAEVTADLLAMAGAFKNMGIEPDKLAGLFGEAMKIDSEQGNEWLAFLTRNTGMGIEKLRGMIEKGDVTTPMQLFIKQLKKDGPNALKMNEKFYTEMTGMSFAQLRKLMDADSSAVGKLIADNRKAMKQQDLHKKRALARQNEMSRSWNMLKNVFADIWIKVGMTVASVAKELKSTLIPVIKDVMAWFAKTAKWAASPEGGKQIKQWVKDVGRFLKEDLWPALQKVGRAFVWISENPKLIAFIGGFTLLLGKLVPLLTATSMAGGGVFGVIKKLGPVLGVVAGKVLLVVTALAALYAGAKKIANWVESKAVKKLEGESKARSTTHGIVQAVKGSAGEKFGFVKSEMNVKGGTGLVTPGGKVNTKELQRRAAQAAPGNSEVAKLSRAAMVKSWTAGIQTAIKGTDVDRIKKSIVSDKQAAVTKAVDTATDAGAAPAVAPAPKLVGPAPAVESTKSAIPQNINVKADSPESQKVLGDIRDILNNMNMRGKTVAPHPTDAALRGSLG